jgi:hypothetical protein
MYLGAKKEFFSKYDLTVEVITPSCRFRRLNAWTLR